MKSLLRYALLFSLVAAGSASAQQALEEIIVTTKRGSANVQDIAGSIGVLTGDTLEAMGAQEFEDIARTVVGLDVVNRAVGDNTIVIRGVNADGESGAAILWDNMPTSGAGEDTSDLGRRQYDLEVYDVQQVEVLRGPRGTLYGSNSLAGVVRFVTNKPDLDGFDAGFTTRVDSVSGGDSGTVIKGFLNVPVSDNVGLRLALYNREVGGFIDSVQYKNKHPKAAQLSSPNGELIGVIGDDINGYERSGFRLSMSALLGDDTDLLLQYFSQDTDANAGAMDQPFAGCFGPCFPGSPTQWAPAGVRKVNKSGKDRTVETLDMFGITLNHDLDRGTLTWTSSASNKDTDLESDISGLMSLFGWFAPASRARVVGNSAKCTAAMISNDSSDGQGFGNPAWRVGGGPPSSDPFCRQYAGDGAEGGVFQSVTDMDLTSHEVRFSSSLPGRVNYLVGYFSQDRDISLENAFLETNPNTGAIIPLSSTNAPMYARGARFLMETSALFGEITIDVSDRFRANFGARYFDNWNKDTGYYSYPFFQGTKETTYFPASGDPLTATETGNIKKVELSYDIADDRMMYFIAGQGFRSGGTINQIEAGMPARFNHDYTWNYEFGWKSVLGESTLFNASYYQIDFYDMQYSVDFSGGAFQAQVNCSGKCATVTGFEVEVDARPTDRLRVLFNAATNDSEVLKNLYNGWPFSEGSIDSYKALKGDPLVTHTPSLSYSAALQYTWPTGNNRNGYFFADYRHTGEIDIINNVRDSAGNFKNNIPVDSWSTINLRAGLQAETWQVGAFVRNATDQVGTLYQNAKGNPSMSRRVINAPRTIGVEFSYNVR